jgi:hypothetical protein
MNLEPEPIFVMVKCFFHYTHASKTQKFKCKMNFVRINLKTNMGMNDFFHSSNVRTKRKLHLIHVFNK